MQNMLCRNTKKKNNSICYKNSNQRLIVVMNYN